MGKAPTYDHSCINLLRLFVSCGPRVTKLSNLVVVAPIDLCFCTMISTGKIFPPLPHKMFSSSWVENALFHTQQRWCREIHFRKSRAIPKLNPKKAPTCFELTVVLLPAPSQYGTIQPSRDVGLVAIFGAVSRSPTIQTRRSSLAKILIILFALAYKSVCVCVCVCMYICMCVNKLA